MPTDEHNHPKRNTREELEERAKQREELRAKSEQLHNDRVQLLAMPEFKRVMADIMERGRMFDSVMVTSSMIYHHSGRQDFCREIWATLAEADRDKAFDILKTDN